MKTFTLLVIALLFKAFTLQAQSIPNAGFENLNSDGTISNWGNVYLVSFSFDSLGNSYSDSIVYDNQYYAPSTDAHSGNTALELRNAWNYSTNTGIAGAVASDDDSVFSSWGLLNLVPTYATPFTPFAPFNFGFYYKYFPVNGDSAYAQIALWDSSGNQLAQGEIIITDAESNYTLISAPINYTATGDVAFYSFSISTFYSAYPGSRQPGFGTRLLVDDIGFNFAAVTGINEIKKDDQFQIYPNPATDELNIVTNVTKPIQYTIYNSFGQEVSVGTLQPYIYNVPLGNIISSGIFIIVMNNGSEVVKRSFIKKK